MATEPTNISIERVLKQDIPDIVSYCNHILLVDNLSDMRLFSHPARLRATTVLVCTQGIIESSINLKNYTVAENHLLVNFSGDIIQIHRTENVRGYAIILSEEYLREVQLDFRMRAQSYMNIRGNGPVAVPRDELTSLKPYYRLFKKNMEEGNADVIRGLAQALSYTIISLLNRYNKPVQPDGRYETSRKEQLFEKFMSLLDTYHGQERAIQFYADKMCLTPKYLSGMIKAYSGKGPLEWINEFVILEAKMMLRYTDLSVQEIAYRLNFPTQSAFGKYFKQQIGASPKHFRNNN
jgi:AraC family transcriptional activator of pobA